MERDYVRVNPGLLSRHMLYRQVESYKVRVRVKIGVRVRVRIRVRVRVRVRVRTRIRVIPRVRVMVITSDKEGGAVGAKLIPER